MAVNLAVILPIIYFIGNLVSHPSCISELYLHHVSTRIYLVPRWHCQTSLKFYKKFAFKLGGGRRLLDLEMWLFICLKRLALKLSLCQIKKKKSCIGKVRVCTPLSQDHVILALYAGSDWCGKRQALWGPAWAWQQFELTALAPPWTLKKRPGIGI